MLPVDGYDETSELGAGRGALEVQPQKHGVAHGYVGALLEEALHLMDDRDGNEREREANRAAECQQQASRDDGLH